MSSFFYPVNGSSNQPVQDGYERKRSSFSASQREVSVFAQSMRDGKMLPNIEEIKKTYAETFKNMDEDRALWHITCVLITEDRLEDAADIGLMITSTKIKDVVLNNLMAVLYEKRDLAKIKHLNRYMTNPAFHKQHAEECFRLENQALSPSKADVAVECDPEPRQRSFMGRLKRFFMPFCCR